MEFDASKFEATVTDCSYDRNEKRSLVESEVKVINFDRVKTDFACINGISEPKSVDSLAFDEQNNPVFIEFKNIAPDALVKGDKKKDLTQKIYDSVLLYCTLYNENPAQIRTRGTYIIVYNEEKDLRPRHQLIKTAQQRATDKVLRFVHSQLRRWLVVEIKEFSSSEFIKYLECHQLSPICSS